MRALILLTLTLILVPIATRGEENTGWMEPETSADAHGSDPNVAVIDDQPGDPVIPQEELHLTKAEEAEVGDPGEVKKVEAADHHDEELEHELAAEEQREEQKEKEEEAARIKEEADRKIAEALKAQHRKDREAHHKNFLAHHMDKLKKLVALIKDRIIRHKKAKHHEKS